MCHEHHTVTTYADGHESVGCPMPDWYRNERCSCGAKVMPKGERCIDCELKHKQRQL